MSNILLGLPYYLFSIALTYLLLLVIMIIYFYYGCVFIMEDTPTIPLINVPSGNKVQIINIDAGWGLQRRLADMGLTPGLRVTVVGNHKPGSVVLNVRGSRLALGRGISNKIMVQI